MTADRPTAASMAIARNSVKGAPLTAERVALMLDAVRERAFEDAAQIADSFTCGACGMDGKSSIAIRALAVKGAADE